jgi:phage tail sheath protein FI
MPEYLAPGVYVEEISTGPKPIEGVGTSTAGFLGATERGPEYPRLVTGWLDFQRWYGGYIPESYLAYAVQGFFENGGQRCFVGRIAPATPAVPPAVSGTPPVAATASLSGSGTDLQVVAIGRGTWGNSVEVELIPASMVASQPTWFQLIVRYMPGTPAAHEERYDNLTHDMAASNSVMAIVNSNSRLIRVWWPKDTTSRLNVPQAPQAIVKLGGGAGGDEPIVSDFLGKASDEIPFPVTNVQDLPPRMIDLLGRGWGLAGMETVDEVAILAVPDEVRTGLRPISGDVISQCEKLKDRFAIISAVQTDSDPNQISPSNIRDTSYAAFYYPWIRIFDPTLNTTRLIPPTGHIAGIYARSDIERGVHKAPANEVVRGAFDLALPVTKGDQDILNPKGVNCIRDFRSDERGIRVWGARTMASDPEWKYVNVRRLFIFVEESIDQGTQWVVFEPNDQNTWARVVRSITGFLTTVWRSGALMGTTQDEAFFVKCDRTTMTQDDIDNGRLICYIGIAPVKPAEFVIFRISQKTAEAPA